MNPRDLFQELWPTFEARRLRNFTQRLENLRQGNPALDATSLLDEFELRVPQLRELNLGVPRPFERSSLNEFRETVTAPWNQWRPTVSVNGSFELLSVRPEAGATEIPKVNIERIDLINREITFVFEVGRTNGDGREFVETMVQRLLGEIDGQLRNLEQSATRLNKEFRERLNP